MGDRSDRAGCLTGIAPDANFRVNHMLGKGLVGGRFHGDHQGGDPFLSIGLTALS
jgi:hypothetical protein